MKKLLICTPCASSRGGVERIIESLHDGLPAHGIEVVVGLAKGQYFHRPERYRGEYPGLNYIEIDGTSGTRTGRLRGLREVLRKVRPDIVLVARLFDAYQAVCERKLAGDRVRLTVTIQAYEPEYISDLALYEDFVDLCVPSDYLVADAIRHFTKLPASRIRSIGGGVRPARRRVVREDHQAPLRLGYVGRLEWHQKRIFDLVEILAALDSAGVPFSCEIAGSGPDEADLCTRLQNNGLDRKVKFRGWLSSEELYETLYPNVEVFLHVAAWEGSPIAPREAMAHGAVPVVSEFVGCRGGGTFQNGKTALTFPVGDTALAARHIQRLYQNREEWQRLSDAAAATQTGIFSHDGAIAAWAEALHALAEQAPAVGSKVPDVPFPPAGRLDRLMTARGAEFVRRLFHKYAFHADAGGEWPHCSGLASTDSLQRLAAYARTVEEQDRTCEKSSTIESITSKGDPAAVVHSPGARTI